jgi:hypothetical protein
MVRNANPSLYIPAIWLVSLEMMTDLRRSRRVSKGGWNVWGWAAVVLAFHVQSATP